MFADWDPEGSGTIENSSQGVGFGIWIDGLSVGGTQRFGYSNHVASLAVLHAFAYVGAEHNGGDGHLIDPEVICRRLGVCRRRPGVSRTLVVPAPEPNPWAERCVETLHPAF